MSSPEKNSPGERDSDSGSSLPIERKKLADGNALDIIRAGSVSGPTRVDREPSDEVRRLSAKRSNQLTYYFDRGSDITPVPISERLRKESEERGITFYYLPGNNEGWYSLYKSPPDALMVAQLRLRAEIEGWDLLEGTVLFPETAKEYSEFLPLFEHELPGAGPARLGDQAEMRFLASVDFSYRDKRTAIANGVAVQGITATERDGETYLNYHSSGEDADCMLVLRRVV